GAAGRWLGGGANGSAGGRAEPGIPPGIGANGAGTPSMARGSTGAAPAGPGTPPGIGIGAGIPEVGAPAPAGACGPRPRRAFRSLISLAFLGCSDISVGAVMGRL